MKVFVYFNLHKKCFSIKALEGAMKGRVVAHRDNVLLFHTTFKVSQAGRERVLREKRKNVHAGVCGTWYDSGDKHGTLSSVKERGELVTYNPYKYTSFVYKEDESEVDKAWCAGLFVDPASRKASIYAWSM
jgi:hypothetical protein